MNEGGTACRKEAFVVLCARMESVVVVVPVLVGAVGLSELVVVAVGLSCAAVGDEPDWYLRLPRKFRSRDLKAGDELPPALEEA